MTDKSQESKGVGQNFLEWMSGRGIPDSSRGLLVALLLALTITPYLGGKSIWSFGATPLNIPTIPAAAFWPIVFFTPILWSLVFVRLIDRPWSKILLTILVALFLSCLSIVAHVLYRDFALDAITPNFDRTYQLGFQEVGHSWIAAHRRDNSGDRYCHFRTAPISLGQDVRTGCTLRVDRISIEGGGRADVTQAPDKQAAFDLEVFVSSGAMLSEATGCVGANDWQNVKARPQNPEVHGHAVIYVPQPAQPTSITNYAASYDFANFAITASPVKGPFTELIGRNVDVSDTGAQFQISGWTLWGNPVVFQFDALALRLNGRLHCSVTSLFSSTTR